MRVAVYRNLHKPGVVYSLRDTKTGRVVGYASDVLLTNVKFRVQKAGRERVLREKRKHVHAFVMGDVVEVELAVLDEVTRQLAKELGPWEAVRYNPYKYESFVRADNESPIFEAGVAVVGQKGVLAITGDRNVTPNKRRPSLRELLDEQLLWQD